MINIIVGGIVVIAVIYACFVYMNSGNLRYKDVNASDNTMDAVAEAKAFLASGVDCQYENEPTPQKLFAKCLRASSSSKPNLHYYRQTHKRINKMPYEDITTLVTLYNLTSEEIAKVTVPLRIAQDSEYGFISYNGKLFKSNGAGMQDTPEPYTANELNVFDANLKK